MQFGIRNSHLLTVAPTGSTGTMTGVSTGLEPYYSFSYFRSGRLGKFIEINAAIVEEYLANHPNKTKISCQTSSFQQWNCPQKNMLVFNVRFNAGWIVRFQNCQCTERVFCKSGGESLYGSLRWWCQRRYCIRGWQP